MRFLKKYNHIIDSAWSRNHEEHGFYFISIEEYLRQQQEARLKELQRRR